MATTNRIRMLLDEQGKSQRWLAGKVGCEEKLISGICNGNGCHLKTAHKIAAALGRDTDEVFPNQFKDAA